MISRYSVRTAAKALAQDAGPGSSATGVQLLFRESDYDLVLLQALRLFTKDRPNLRVVDHTIAAAGFRLVLTGTGALSSLAGRDAWVLGHSDLRAVYLPWDVTAQAPAPIDENTWRVVQDPGPAAVLELLTRTAAVGDVLRLVFTAPHALTEAPNTVAAPTQAPVAGVAADAGVVTAGTHSYVYTFVTAQGETTPSPASNQVTVVTPSTDGQVRVTVQPSPDAGVTAVRLYRTVAGDTGSRLLVAQSDIGKPTSIGYVLVDNVADGSLGAAAPSSNTAGGANTVFDADEEALTILAASLILQEAAVKAVQNTGNSGFPNDIVDRRTQSDIFRSRAKELREQYAALMGLGTARSELAPASAVRDLDVPDRFGLGRLWLGTGVR